jgi:predicted Fe-S protein YdhL (DUF1289 family)
MWGVLGKGHLSAALVCSALSEDLTCRGGLRTHNNWQSYSYSTSEVVGHASNYK